MKTRWIEKAILLIIAGGGLYVMWAVAVVIFGD